MQHSKEGHRVENMKVVTGVSWTCDIEDTIAAVDGMVDGVNDDTYVHGPEPFRARGADSDRCLAATEIVWGACSTPENSPCLPDGS